VTDTFPFWNLSVANYKSGGNRKHKQAVAVGFPGTFLNVDWPWRWFTSSFIGCHASQALVHAPFIEVISESRQLLVQVGGIPKEELVQIFAAYGPNEPFHKWIRNGHVTHRG
jgi:hypothetical protein